MRKLLCLLLAFGGLSSAQVVLSNYGDPTANPALAAALAAKANTSALGTAAYQPSSAFDAAGAAGTITPSGADPTGAADSYSAIQSALTSACSNHLAVSLPAGTYKVSAGLSAPCNDFKMYGTGTSTTTITASATGYDVLTIGPGTSGIHVGANGYLRQIALSGAGRSNTSDGHSVLKLSGAIQYRVDDVQADNADIGIDLVNNDYGSQFTNIRVGFGSTVNAGVYLRTGPQSGSDIDFTNPWVAGKICGVCIAGGGGGYHFRGGQIGAGQNTSSATDTSASVILGKDYLTGTTGESSADFVGTSFEDTNYAWMFQSFDLTNLKLIGIYANPASSAYPAIGFYKGTNMQNSLIMLDSVTISGNWSATNLLSFAGPSSPIWWVENQTYTAGNHPMINGVSTFVPSLLQQSSYSQYGYYVDNTSPSVSGVRFRGSGSAFQTSSNNGSNWYSLLNSNSNLSDLGSASTARTNLGLTSLATATAPTGSLVGSGQANTYSAGAKQTFTGSSTTASHNIVGVSTDPTTLVVGDMWVNTASKHPKYYDGTTAQTMALQSDLQNIGGNLLFGADSTYNIGASAANRPAYGYFGTGVSTSNGASIANWNAIGTGAWINMPTTGASGIGTGGPGANPWIAYAYQANNWFNDAAAGDICYRSNSGAIRIGIGGGGGPSEFYVNTSGSTFNTNVFFGTDNSYNIGTTSASRPANIYVGTKVSTTLEQYKAGTFSALPTCNSGAEGTNGAVTDSTTATYAATITGSGTNHVHAYCNGTNWVVD